ncbi:MAG: hypothetical protein ACR2MW_12050 [Chthoniobacterales bacterium]
MATGKIIDLRRLLAERFPQESLPPGERLPTGLATFDDAMGGGLTKGAITELSSPAPQTGSATLLALLLRRAWRERYFIALIDGRDSFDPESVNPAALPHLLWIRCAKTSEALQAADLLLRDGNFPLVVLDLVLNPAPELRKIPQSNWYRLQRLVEPAPTAFLVLTPQNMISSAQWKLALENQWTLSQLEAETAELSARLQFRRQRGQPNESRKDAALSQAG